MSQIIIKKDPLDKNNYFYRDISGLGLPDPNIRAMAVRDNYIYMIYGNQALFPSAAKINIGTLEIEEYFTALDIASSSAGYSSTLGLKNLDTPLNNKAILWNFNTLVVVTRTASPVNGITIAKVNLDTNSVTLRLLSDIDINTYILDYSISGNDLFLVAKTGLSAANYNKIYKIDISTHSASGHPTTEYQVDSTLIDGQSVNIYNNVIYFIGGRCYNNNTGIVEYMSTKYFSIDILNLSSSDCMNEQQLSSAIAMPSLIGEIPLSFEGSMVHMPANPFIYTANLRDGSVFKNSAPEVISGNCTLNNGDEIILLNFATGTIYIIGEPSSIHLVAHGVIQFYDKETTTLTTNPYYKKTINKIDGEKFVSMISIPTPLISTQAVPEGYTDITDQVLWGETSQWISDHYEGERVDDEDDDSNRVYLNRELAEDLISSLIIMFKDEGTVDVFVDLWDREVCIDIRECSSGEILNVNGFLRNISIVGGSLMKIYKVYAMTEESFQGPMPS